MVGASPLALLAVAARTLVVLAVAVAGLRLFGRRHVGEMDVEDILLVLLLANAVQNAMTRGRGDLSVALVASCTLVASGWVAAGLFRHFPFLERRLEGRPAVLVHDGVKLDRNLRREQLTDEELAVAMRQQGLTELADVKLAVLESNGVISVVPRSDRDHRP